MLNETEIMMKVKKAMSEKLGLIPSEIVPEAHLLFDFGITDDDWINLKPGLEEQFNIKISDLERIQQLKTVQDIIDYMKSHLSEINRRDFIVLVKPIRKCTSPNGF